MIDFVNKGNVTELQDVIPHLDADECVRRYKTQNLMKSRGRQVCLFKWGGWLFFIIFYSHF